MSSTLNKYQTGLSLVEVLIGLAISGAIMISMMNTMADSDADMRGKNMAEGLQGFQQAATQYFVANRAEMLDAMTNTVDFTNANKHCRIDVPPSGIGGETKIDPVTRLTCMLDGSLLMAKGSYPNTNSTNYFRHEWVAVFRRLRDGAGIPTDNVDMLIVGALNAAGAGNSMTPREIRAATEVMGGNGGGVFETTQPGCAPGQACGQAGGWLVNLSDFGLSK